MATNLKQEIHKANQSLYESRMAIAGIANNRRLVRDFITTSLRRSKAYPKSEKVAKELDDARRAYIRLTDELGTAQEKHEQICKWIIALQKRQTPQG